MKDRAVKRHAGEGWESRMKWRWISVMPFLALAACAEGSSVRETSVSATELPFELAALKDDGAVAGMQRFYDRRTGDETYVVHLLDFERDGELVLVHSEVGPGRLMDMSSAEANLAAMMPGELAPSIETLEQAGVAGRATTAWIHGVSADGRSCARFVTPLDRSVGYDNAAVVAFDSAIFGQYCKDGENLARREVEVLLGSIKLRE